MKRFIIAAVFLLPISAFAQPAPDPNMQAAGQEIMECVSAKIQLRAQAFAAQQHEKDAIAAAVAKQKADDQAPAK